MLSIKTCSRCEKTFKTRHALKKYCSGDCFVATEADRNRAHAAKYSPQRRRAYSLIQAALMQGRLVREPCEACGDAQRPLAHHDDYAKPLNVRWLCGSCHKNHHRQHGPGLNAFRKEISA